MKLLSRLSTGLNALVPSATLPARMTPRGVVTITPTPSRFSSVAFVSS